MPGETLSPQYPRSRLVLGLFFGWFSLAHRLFLGRHFDGFSDDKAPFPAENAPARAYAPFCSPFELLCEMLSFCKIIFMNSRCTCRVLDRIRHEYGNIVRWRGTYTLVRIQSNINVVIGEYL